MMTVNLEAPENLKPVNGIRLASAEAGIRYSGRKDLVLMEIAGGSQCAAVFTRNAFCAAPVVMARQHLSATAPGYLLINSGNANAGTGEQGWQDAQQCCRLVAEQTGCQLEQVLPFSTGVIGEHLPVARFAESIPRLSSQLQADGWLDAAHAIMTTDTLAKGISKTIVLDGNQVTVTGIAKGSGMIKPDMATMLSFIATDAVVDRACLQAMLEQAVGQSFNRITVDGDTSTNDACVLVATGQAGHSQVQDIESEAGQQLLLVLSDVCRWLAQAIIRDAEGVNRFITIDVVNAVDEQEAASVAFTVAHSPLVKTAFFAGDPNWGRILAAVGRAGIDALDINTVKLYLDDVCIVEQGGRSSAYTEEQGQAVMKKSEVTILIDLGRGTEQATVWTSDLSYDYVRINAEYRT